MYGSLEDVQRDMDSDEYFVRDAYAADVGIASPPMWIVLAKEPIGYN